MTRARVFALALVMAGCAIIAFAVTLRGVDSTILAAYGGFLTAVGLFAIDVDRSAE